MKLVEVDFDEQGRMYTVREVEISIPESYPNCYLTVPFHSVQVIPGRKLTWWERLVLVPLRRLRWRLKGRRY